MQSADRHHLASSLRRLARGCAASRARAVSAKITSALIHRFHLLMSRVFTSWSTLVSQSKSIRRMARRSAKSRALARWRSRCLERKKRRYDRRVARAFNDGVVKLRAFCALFAFVTHSARSREANRIADDHLRLAVTRRAVGAWRGEAREGRRRRKQPQYRVLATRYFDLLLQHAEGRKREKEKFLKASLHRDGVLKLRAFESLRSEAGRSRRLRMRSDAVKRGRERRVRGEFLRRWAARHDDSVITREKTNRADRCWRVRVMGRVVDSLRANVTANKGERRRGRLRDRKVLIETFTSWRIVSSALRSSRSRALDLGTRRRNLRNFQLVSVTFLRWADLKSWALARSQRAREFDSARVRGIRDSAFFAIREMSGRRRSLDDDCRRLHFLAWGEFAAGRRAGRVRSATAMHFWATVRKERTWRAWRWYVEGRRERRL